MPDRTVSYNFRANFTQFTAGLAAMGKSVEATAGKLTALDKNGAKMRAGLATLGKAGGAVGLGLAAGVAASVASAAKFEQAMSSVQAATHETASNMALLRQAALDAGSQTAYSATEAAGAIEALSKAGVSTSDILDGGLTGALNLAAAGSLDVSSAAEIAATTLTQFGLAGDQASRVADVLAAGAGKAQGEVTDMAGALKYVGPVAAQMGISLEETAGTIAELASQGIIGEQAGTSLRGMLTSLTSPSKVASEQMAALGINLYDTAGRFVGLDGIAGQLHDTMSGLTNAERDQALGRIFGNEQITAARILYAEGAEGVQKWTRAVNDSGYAAETAALKQDNLMGDLEKLGGAFETAFIGAGAGSQGMLRGLVQNLTSVVDAFNDLPPSVQSATTALAGIGAVAGGGLFVGSKVISGIAETKQALSDLGIEAINTRSVLASVGKGIEFAAIGASVEFLTKRIEDLANVNLEGNLDRNLAALADGRVVGNLDNMGGYLDEVNNGLGRYTHYVGDLLPFYSSNFSKDAEQIQKVDEALASMVETGNADVAGKAFAQIVDQADKAGVSVGEVTKNFDQYQLALLNAGLIEPSKFFSSLGSTISSAIAPTQGLASATAGLGDSNDDARQAILGAMDAMRDQRDEALGTFDAVTQYRQAMNAAAEQAKSNKAGIQGSSDAALRNRDALSQLASAWNGQSNATKNASGAFKAARSNFIETATAMGVPKRAAEQLAASVLQIPKSRQIRVDADTAAAQAALAATKAKLDAIKDRSVTVTVRTNNIRPQGGSVLGPGIATGGHVRGPGTSTSDSIPARLSDGEFVMRAAAVKTYGVDMMHAINSLQLGAQSTHKLAGEEHQGRWALASGSFVRGTRPAIGWAAA